MNYTVTIMIIYLLVCLFLGYLGYKKESKESTDESFFLSDRDMNWFFLAFTMMATYFSCYALLGVAGAIHTIGLPFLTVSMFSPFLAAMVIWHICRRINYLGKEYRYITPADMLVDFYRLKPLRILVPIIAFCYNIPMTTIQLIGGGKVIQMATNGAVSYKLAVFLVLVFIMVYGVMGGMRTIAWTDGVQGIMLLGGMLLVGYFAGFRLFNSPGELWALAAAKIPQYLTMPGGDGSMPYRDIIPQVAIIGFAMVPCSSSFWLRSYAARGVKELKISATLQATILPAAYLFAYALVGIGSKVAFPNHATPDDIPLELVATYAGPILVGLFFAAVAAAGMSTADSTLHASSALFTIDIYKNFINPDSTPKQLAWVGRFFMIVIGLLSYVVTLYWPKMIFTLALIAYGFGVQLLPSLIGCLFWKRGTKWGVLYGMLAGLLSCYLFMFVWVNPFNIQGGFLSLFVNALVFVVVSYLTPAEPQEIIERFQGFLRKKINSPGITGSINQNVRG